MNLSILGIDIAKLKFNVCLLNTDGKLKHKVFPNTEAGFQQLDAWVIKHKVDRVHACLEATGAYGEALALHLHAAGHTVSVINPAATKSFAGSRLSRIKTDKVDAELIARFCVALQPAHWTPPAREVRQLQALVRRLDALVEMYTMEQNRRQAIITIDVVKASVQEHMMYLDHQIKQTKAAIRRHINSPPACGDKASCSTPFRASPRQPPPRFWPNSQTSHNTGARVRSPLTPD